MFVKLDNSGYDRGDQTATGRYLSLFQYPSSRRLFGAVRRVKLTQCGHFMMGSMRLGGKSITVSGQIGSDGLPLDWDKLPANAQANPLPFGLLELPADVADIYWADKGHNELESAARVALKSWAWDNMPFLRGGYMKLKGRSANQVIQGPEVAA